MSVLHNRHTKRAAALHASWHNEQQPVLVRLPESVVIADAVCRNNELHTSVHVFGNAAVVLI